MESLLQEFGSILPQEPLGFQESQPSMQETHQRDHCSYPSLLAHPQQVPGQALHFGGYNGLLDGGIRSTESLWQRIKWTNEMVKLLITAVSYVGEDSFSESPEGERRSRVKGKWRAISKCMIERGYFVSPQQCEDKFNDLNKKFKRLNDVVGSADSRIVVENPALVETMDILVETKEEVRKILMCKQLFYQEMFSYHNRDWSSIPQDESLRLSLLSALRGKIKHVSPNVIQEIPVKRQKRGEDQVVSTPSDTHSLEPANLTQVCQKYHNPSIIARLLQLQEMKKQIQDEKIELEKKKFGWLKSNQLEDRELHELKLENEILKLENERLMLDLKSWEIRTNKN